MTMDRMCRTLDASTAFMEGSAEYPAPPVRQITTAADCVRRRGLRSLRARRRWCGAMAGSEVASRTMYEQGGEQ